MVWDAAENGLKKGYFHSEFMKEAGLYDEVDRMIYWKWKYKDKIKKGWTFYHGIEVELRHPDYEKYQDLDDGFSNFRDYFIYLGDQYEKRTRSISNKGDVTKEEMSRLLMEVIKFGASNDVPDCFIEDREFKRMVEACGR